MTELYVVIIEDRHSEPIEREEKYFDIACKRISQAEYKPRLFKVGRKKKIVNNEPMKIKLTGKPVAVGALPAYYVRYCYEAR